MFGARCWRWPCRCWPAAALAQAWPSKPVTLVVPFPPGGPTDTAARIIGEKLSASLKQPVIIENKAGASGTIAAQGVAKSAPDGYTLMLLATPTLLAPHLMRPKGYDLFSDFVPVPRPTTCRSCWW